MSGGLFNEANTAGKQMDIQTTKEQAGEEILEVMIQSEPYDRLTIRELKDIIKKYSNPEENYKIIDQETGEELAFGTYYGLVTVIINENKNGNGPVIIEDIRIGRTSNSSSR